MPGIEEDENVPTSWADIVEEEELPSPRITIKNGVKSIVEYKVNEDGKKVKVTQQYRVENRKFSKSVARRKKWKKFGAAAYDKPGPNPATTIISEDVFMTFITAKDHECLSVEEDNPLSSIKGQKLVQCRICKGEHWTTRCPFKDTLQPLQEKTDTDQRKTDAKNFLSRDDDKNRAGKYIPPSLREGSHRQGESMQNTNRDDTTIRVSNLSENVSDIDLHDLFDPFGPIMRIFLAKDKVTNKPKGFAFITYKRREDAARAIAAVCGFGYDHLILNVEWAKPSSNA